MNNLVEPCLEQLYLIETERGPRSETALLKEVLRRCPEWEPELAYVNAYKHRLHALRCENVNLRLRIQDLETQLNQMRATRGWRLLEKYRRWRRMVSGWFREQTKPEA